jgi:hypothetical protein
MVTTATSTADPNQGPPQKPLSPPLASPHCRALHAACAATVMTLLLRGPALGLARQAQALVRVLTTSSSVHEAAPPPKPVQLSKLKDSFNDATSGARAWLAGRQPLRDYECWWNLYSLHEGQSLM